MLKPVMQPLILLLVFLLAQVPASAQDISKYYTVMHPDEFEIDWTGFYQSNIESTLRVRREYPHHLDLKFGDDAKQASDR